MKRYFFVASVLSVMVLLGPLSACKKAAVAAKASRKVNVVLANATKQKFEDKIRVQANVGSTQTADISARVSGNIDVIKVDTGTSVKKGDLLFTIDHINLENDVKAQEAKVKVAESEHNIALINLNLAKTITQKEQIDYERSKELYDSKVVSKDALEKRELALKEAFANIDKASANVKFTEARVEQEVANLDIAKKQLSDSEILAPFDAVVVDKAHDPDEYVSSGTIIMQLENPRQYEIVAYISAEYYDKIEVGKTKAIVYASNGKVLGEVTISYKSPSIDSMSRTFELKALLPKTYGIVSGMMCDIDIILRSSDGYGIPTEAIIEKNNNNKVIFVANKDNSVELIPVKTDIVDGNKTQILNVDDLKNRPVVIQGQTFLGSNDMISDVTNK